MEFLKQISAKIKNYKCFGNEENGFDEIKPMNIIIGRNNTGKSSLLDFIEYCTTADNTKMLLQRHKESVPMAFFTKALKEEELRRFFQAGSYGGSISGDHWEYGKKWIEQEITWSVDLFSNSKEFIKIDPLMNISNSTRICNQIIQQFTVPFSAMRFKRLLSDRDIVAEVRNDVDIFPNGKGVTSNVANFLTKSSLPSELIEETILNEINKIFEPDSKFILIDAQELPDQMWEIYLSEEKKGKIALSQSGSGLKTIICLLAFLNLIPYKEKKKVNQYIFGFEEFENNLHPSVQRRLFTYLRDFALENGCIFFVTTHSSVVIDLFSKDPNAQIIHVTHDGEKAKVSKTTTYIEHKGILDDLDVRASDLLQSNSIIWVEGPSDRLYFNKWIELWSDGKLREGIHYQCVFYGGRLLAHLSAKDPGSNVEDLVKILRINRNCILIMDSDKRKDSDGINATKTRVIKEINDVGGFSWMTEGKEVENYLPKEVFETIYDKHDLNQIKKFETIKEYLELVSEGEGVKFLNNKVLYAEYFIEHLTKENLAKVLDMEHKLNLVCDKIRRWNGLNDEKFLNKIAE